MGYDFPSRPAFKLALSAAPWRHSANRWRSRPSWLDRTRSRDAFPFAPEQNRSPLAGNIVHADVLELDSW